MLLIEIDRKAGCSPLFLCFDTLDYSGLLSNFTPVTSRLSYHLRPHRMKKLLPFALCISLVLFSFRSAQQAGKPPVKCTYGTFQGRFDGKYVSYYPNGKKKAEGRFRNNYRDGKWQVWNEDGLLLVERDYTNPFEFKQTYPRISEDAGLYTAYKLERNSDGCYKHFTFREDRVIAVKRLWRFIAIEANPFLFSSDNRLFRVISEAVKNGGLKTYGSDSLVSSPTTAITGETGFRVIGFRTMEDWVFDRDRLVGEYYTIAICPVVINLQTKDTSDLYWINLEQARPFMAKEYMNDLPLPKHIETLDDIIFFHYFHGQVYKEYNEENKQLSELVKPHEIEAEALKIDLNLIDHEHNIWTRDIYK